MPDTHWLDSGAASLSYTSAPRPTAPYPGLTKGTSITPKAPTTPAVPTPPKLPTPATSPTASVSPAAGAGGVPPTGPGSLPQPSGGGGSLLHKAVSTGVQGLNTYGNYQTGTWAASKMLPAAAPAAAGTSLAMRIPAVYGAYALGDAAMTPITAAMGGENFEGMQQAGVHNSYLSNVGSNLMRPGRAAWGALHAGADTLYNGARQFMRGQSLDAQSAAARAPRPTQPMRRGGAF